MPLGKPSLFGNRNQLWLHFHIYDYLRPDLNGNLREIHLDHAFSVLNSHLNLNFSPDRLRPTLEAIRVQRNGTEYLLKDKRDTF